MKFSCPYCGAGMAAKTPKPGRFRPVCPACRERFFMEIPDPTPRVYRLCDAPESSGRSFDGSSMSSIGLSGGLADATAPLGRERTAPTSTRPMGESDLAETAAGVSANGSVEASSTRGDDEPGSGATSTGLERSGGRRETSPSNETAGFESNGADDADFSVAASASASPGKALDVPPTLGGYRIEKELGRGAMGAVYLARQVSLDRLAALKVIQRKYADNPTFISRFVREAYAAAQLTHHNIVQVYDMGEQDGAHFFSMEFVKGRTLDAVLKEKGRLPADVAVGYLLQACRGLKFAHDSGMVHRDVKPANMMINDQGIVKIADLGLVKTPGEIETKERARGSSTSMIDRWASADLTSVGGAMGTPAYMAPEQAADASSVDHRADIYSLGCTFYVMLTGRPVFQGTTVKEVITKHMSEPVVRPEAIVQRLPSGLSEINMRMVAKHPNDRYQSLGEVVQDLEDYLGVTGGATASISGEQADRLETACERFRDARWARLRSILLKAFAVLGILGVLLSFLTGNLFAIGGAIALATLTPLAYFAFRGLFVGDPLFARARTLFFEARWVDWFAWTLVAVAICATLALSGLLLPVVAFAVVAVGLGAGLHFGLDRLVAAQRGPIVDEVETLLRRLRLQGVDDVRLREVVAQTAGKHWEEFFEALFGYDAKIQARRTRGEGGSDRRPHKYAAWREPLISRIDAVVAERRRGRELKHLARLEAKRLEAEGIAAAEARRQALDSAEAMVENAAAFRSASALGRSSDRRALVKGMLAGRRVGGRAERTLGDQIGRAFGRVLSPKVRFAVGLALVLLCAWWIHENDVFADLNPESFRGLTDLAGTDLQNLGADAAKRAEALLSAPGGEQATRPLSFMPELLAPFFASVNVGLAGLLLMASSLLFSRWSVLFATVGAAVALMLVPMAHDLIPVALPNFGPLSGFDLAAGGSAVALFAFGLFLRGRD